MIGVVLRAKFPGAAVFSLSTSAKAKEVLVHLNPSLVILDWRLDDGTGLDLIRLFRAQLPQTRWLMYTGFASASTLNDAIAAGIDGAVAKRSSLAVLKTAIREVAAGNRYFCEITSSELRRGTELRAFSDRERSILGYVAMGHPAKEIAAMLGLSHKTILNYLVGIREKTGAGSMVQLADFARAHGLTENFTSLPR